MIGKKVILMAVGSLYFVGAAFAEEFEQQEVLFLLEEAYTQEEGESQFGFSLDYSDGRDWALEFEYEYGITDRLQVFFEGPIEAMDERTARFGNIEFGLDYAILKDEGPNSPPELTIGIGVSAPTSSRSDDWEIEPNIRIAKMVSEGLYLHGLLAGEVAIGGGESGFDEGGFDEWVLGGGVGWALNEDVIATLEYLREAERENDDAVTDWETTQFLSGSLAVEFENELIIGAAIAQSVEGDAETRAILKAQIEW